MARVPKHAQADPAVMSFLSRGEWILSELAAGFGLNETTVRNRLAKLDPVRTDGNAKLYRFVEVVEYLAPLPQDVLVERILRLNHMDLPPMLRKEFWTGQAQKQKVLLAEGELFDADTVISYVGELMKIFRMSILLISDSVERETEFTPRQRAALKQIQDNVLETARAEAERLFGSRANDPDGQPGGKPGGTPEPVRTLADEAADL